jgi:hypothetical protein
MFVPGLIGDQQKKHQIHRLPVDRIEIDWVFQLRKEAKEALQTCYARVRNGDTLADTGRAECLTRLERIQDGLATNRHVPRCAPGQLTYQLQFVARRKSRHDTFRADELGDIHAARPFCGGVSACGQSGARIR